jgi:CRISPR-associated protein Cst1
MEKGAQQTNKLQEVSALQFTGSWFIDAGILGFINLLKKVYGWDLDQVRKNFKEQFEIVLYGYFPIAYVHYNKNQQNPFLKEEERPTFNFSTNEEIFEDAWRFIERRYKDKNKNRIDLIPSRNFLMFKNFLFFQPGCKVEKQKDYFMQILSLKNVKEDILRHIDKTVNKFLPSAEKFVNLSYVESFITQKTLLDFHPYSLVFLLCFPFAFIRGLGKENENYFFYSPNLEFTYRINEKLAIFLERLKENEVGEQILRITWKTVIDSAIETQSLWSLENMYIIKHKVGNQQKIVSADYIGIPKLQASIIIDETIRENINITIKLENKKVWLLEEFIKGLPLYPIIVNYVTAVLNSKDYKKLARRSVLYSLIVEAKILEFRAQKEKLNKSLFSENYFDNYRSLLKEIKEEIRFTSYKASLIQNFLDHDEHKERLARELLNSLKGEDKNMFLNILLKDLNEEKQLCTNSNFNNWIFEKIIINNISWKNYALILVMNLLLGRRRS